MNLTSKAEKELKTLKKKGEFLLEELEFLIERRKKETSHKLYMIAQREVVNTNKKLIKNNEKIQRIESELISSGERRALMNETFFMTCVGSGKNPFVSCDTKYVGFSKTINQYVVADITRWSSMLERVRGASSLANKRELVSFKIIDRIEYDKLLDTLKMKGT